MRLTRPPAFPIATCLTFVPAATAQPRRLPVTESQVQTQSAKEGSAVAPSGVSAEETRRDLEELLKQYPPSLPRILHLDPSLLGNPGYLQPYPALAGFLAQHPEVVHNPGYFFAGYDGYSDNRNRLTAQDRAVDMWRQSIQGFTVGVVLLGIGSGLIWLV